MRVPRVCAPVVLLCHCAVADAQISAPYYFDCDVPATRFSPWTATLSSRTLAIRGSIELKEARKDRRWAPAATASLMADDSTQGVGVQLMVDPDEPDVLVVVIQDGRATQRNILATRPWKGQVFDFVLTLRETGVLDVAVLGESRVLEPVAFAPRKLALSCSGAWFEFSDLVISSP